MKIFYQVLLKSLIGGKWKLQVEVPLEGESDSMRWPVSSLGTCQFQFTYDVCFDLEHHTFAFGRPQMITRYEQVLKYMTLSDKYMIDAKYMGVIDRSWTTQLRVMSNMCVHIYIYLYSSKEHNMIIKVWNLY